MCIYRTILINVDDIRGTTDRRSVAARCVVVSTVELIQDESRSVTAEVLDFHQFLLRHKVACGVTGVGGQQHLCATGNFLGNLVRVNVVVVIL